MKTLDELKCQEFFHKMLGGNQNPLELKLGGSLNFPHEIDIKDTNLYCYAISVGHYKNDYQYTDYHLNGRCPTLDYDLNFRLRIQKDHIAHYAHCLLLEVSEQKFVSQLFEQEINEQGQLIIHCDEDGTQLSEPRIYWRIKNDNNPIHTIVQKLAQVNYGIVPLSIKSENSFDCWDFYRQTTNHEGFYYLDFLFVERDEITQKLCFLRGLHIPATQIFRGS